MKKEEFYLNELILILVVIIVGLSGFWYFNSLSITKAQAEASIGELQKTCESQILRKSDCELTQRTYDLENSVLCSSKLRVAEERLNDRIQASLNLIEIKELMRPTPLKDFEELRGELTMGEFATGNDYFKRTSEAKLQVLQNIGALEGCIQRAAKMAEFAKCDLKGAEVFLNPRNAIASFYFGEAERAANAQDYLRALYYSTAAVSYSGEAARQGYADLIEASRTQGLVC